MPENEDTIRHLREINAVTRVVKAVDGLEYNVQISYICSDLPILTSRSALKKYPS